MAKQPKPEAAAQPPSVPSKKMRAFLVHGTDGLVHEGVQYNAVDGVIELPADESWYSMYIDCGWLEEKQK